MSFNGSGLFSINTSGQPVVTNTVASSTAFNALTADLATGLSTCILKDGTQATTARIPFASGINSSLTTDTSSGSTGSIYTAGGIGVAKAIFCGTTLFMGGTTSSEISLRRSNQTLVVALGDNSAFADLHCASLNASGIINSTGLAYGEYTPTLTDIANVASHAASAAQYLRVGNTIFVAFSISIGCTATTLTTIRLSLPVTSAFNSLTNASGCAVSSTSTGGNIWAVSSTALVEYNFVSSATTTQYVHAGTFAYKVI